MLLRRNRTGGGARRAIHALLLCLLAACSSGGPSTADLESSRTEADAFLALLRGGKVDAAWASTSAEFKSMLGQEGLRAYLRKHPTLKEPAEFLGDAAIDRNGLALAECSYKPSRRGASIKVLLALEEGVWKVERLTAE